MGIDERDEPAVFQVDDYEQSRHIPVPDKLQPFIGETPVCKAYDKDECDDEHIQGKDIPCLSKLHEDKYQEIEQHSHADGEVLFQAQAGIPFMKKVHDSSR
jgi:hypothetical protein